MIWIFIICEKMQKTIVGQKARFFKNSFQKLVHKASEFLKNKVADAGTKSNDEKLVKQEPVEEIITTRKKR